VACNLADAVPLVGRYVGYFLRGGPEIGENTLTRFFILHIGVLPTVAFGLIALHILLVRLHGVTELRFRAEKAVPEKRRHFRFWPDHVTTELLIGVLLMYALTILALVFPAGLGAPADPTETPPHIKPEWYFYSSFRLLKLTTLEASVLLTLGAGTLAFFWPFIEQWLAPRVRMTPALSVLLGVSAFLGFFVLTVWESLAP
jgi:quinol-cytochrome oxidoreductase complex cytochrome b subunit